MTATQFTFHDDTMVQPGMGLAEGTLLLENQFTITRILARGGFGITYLATDTNLDRVIVIKECFPEAICYRDGNRVRVRSDNLEGQYSSVVKLFMREARSIAKLRHPNIVGVHRVFEDNGTAYMALDLIDGQDVLDMINDEARQFSPDQVKDMLIKLLDAVALVHDEDLLHRDISPDNILLDKWGSPVLIDFGAAREEASKETRALSSMLIVKDGYSPQEFYFAGGKQTPSSDLYALAATFYHVISGKAPPNSQTRMAEVASNNPDPCMQLTGRFDHYEPDFLAAIDMAMKVLPKDRIQSAPEWAAMIDPDRKYVAPFEKSHIDDSLEKTVMRLVSETNQYVERGKPQSQDKGPSDDDNRVVVADWVREFNAETSEIAHERPMSRREMRQTAVEDVAVDEVREKRGWRLLGFGRGR